MSRIDRFGIALALSAIAWLSGCTSITDAQNALGEGAVCSWVDRDARDAALCVWRGRSWTCVYAVAEWTCAMSGAAPAEAP